MRNQDLRLGIRLLKVISECESLIFLSMDNKDVFKGTGAFFYKVLQLTAVSVSTEGIHDFDFCIHRMGFAENVHGFISPDQFMTQGIFGAESNDQHRIAGIMKI